MINTEKSFYGQQEDEKILYAIRPHPLSATTKTIKVIVVSFVVFLILYLLGQYAHGGSRLMKFLSFVVGGAIIFIGSKLIHSSQKRGISYITDRRVVRFDPTTFFATNIRSLSWDEVVKVKTYSPNILYKQLMVGNVVIHARTTVKTVGEDIDNTVTADDIELKDVYLYRDLGNYVDKILFTYKQKPKEMDSVRAFIPKPRGQRY